MEMHCISFVKLSQVNSIYLAQNHKITTPQWTQQSVQCTTPSVLRLSNHYAKFFSVMRGKIQVIWCNSCSLSMCTAHLNSYHKAAIHKECEQSLCGV